MAVSAARTVCGLTLHDLHALCGNDRAVLLVDCLQDEARLSGLSPDGRKRLDRCTPLLLQAFAARRREHLATQVETLWHQLGGPASCQDHNDLGAARQLLLALWDVEQSQPWLDADTLQALADRLRTGSHSAPGGTVEVLTIHHAKGLEWDAVFVPGLGRRVRSDRPPLLRWLQLPAGDGTQDLLMAVHSIGEQVSSDPLSGYIRQLQKQRQDNERKRLAYVALTRARGRLYLSGHAPWVVKEQTPRPLAGSQLDILWPAVRDTFIKAAGSGPADAPAATWGNAAPWIRLDADYRHQPGRVLPLVQSLDTGLSVSGHARSSAGPVRWRARPEHWCMASLNACGCGESFGLDFNAAYLFTARDCGSSEWKARMQGPSQQISRSACLKCREIPRYAGCCLRLTRAPGRNCGSRAW